MSGSGSMIYVRTGGGAVGKGWLGPMMPWDDVSVPALGDDDMGDPNFLIFR